jgi:tRNA (mo5U34)-methyltransferase
MDLNGIRTPGRVDPAVELERYQVPEDLSGKTVLDIGAWDGFHSFEAERRGASRIVAVDSYAWKGSGWSTKAGFELAREVLGSNVEDREIEVLDLSPETVGVFDVVFFFGVLYHMKHPMLALERVASVTGDRLFLATQGDLFGLRRPAAAFYPGDEMNSDSTNWWGPNAPAVEGMLEATGFRDITQVHPTSKLTGLARLAYRGTRAAAGRARGRRPDFSVRGGQLAFHCRR